jgi:hypothetical protein
MLEFTQLVQALDDSVSDDTEAAIVITAAENSVIVRAFGSTEAIIDALHAALSEITSSHRPRDLRPN